MNSMMRIVLKKGFSWIGKNLIEMVREVRSVWKIVVSIFEMHHNWNELDPRKAVRILKIVFQYLYYLVFRIHRFLRCMIFYILQYFL